MADILGRIHLVTIHLREDGSFERLLGGLTVDGRRIFDTATYANREAMLEAARAQDAAFSERLQKHGAE